MWSQIWECPIWIFLCDLDSVLVANFALSTFWIAPSCGCEVAQQTLETPLRMSSGWEMLTFDWPFQFSKAVWPKVKLPRRTQCRHWFSSFPHETEQLMKHMNATWLIYAEAFTSFNCSEMFFSSKCGLHGDWLFVQTELQNNLSNFIKL